MGCHFHGLFQDTNTRISTDVIQHEHTQTHVVLEKCPSERPDTGEDKVDLVQLSGGVSGRGLLRQQAVQQRTQSLIGQHTTWSRTCEYATTEQYNQSIIQYSIRTSQVCVCAHLHHAVLRDGSDSFEVTADLLQTVWDVFIKQNGQVGPL